MPIPLKQGTTIKMALWLKETKLWVAANVVSSRPGFGIGLQFSEMPEEDSNRLKEFLQSVSRLPVQIDRSQESSVFAILRRGRQANQLGSVVANLDIRPKTKTFFHRSREIKMLDRLLEISSRSE